jgi:hypothetical protein
MSPRSKREYTEAIHKRYKHASRSEKKVILDEFCSTTGYHRKYAIVLLKSFKRFRKPVQKKRGPKSVYRKDEILKPPKDDLAGSKSSLLRKTKSNPPFVASRI